MCAERFISQEISVTRGSEKGNPVAFAWEGREYIIRDIIAVWPDWGFSAGAPRKRTWRMRRHRTCYRVETADGAVFELYYDRACKNGPKWFLHSRLA